MQFFPLDEIILNSVRYGVNRGKVIKLIHNGTYPKQISKIFDYLNLHLEDKIHYNCSTNNSNNVSNGDYNIDLKIICYYPLSPNKEYLNNLIKRIKEID